MALDLPGHGRGPGGAGRDRGGARADDHPAAADGAAAGGRRPAGHLRAAVAAQGHPARHRAQVAARRGQRLPARGGGGQGRVRLVPGPRARLVRLHAGVQGRPAGGPGGGLHRDHVRRQPAQRGRRGDRRGRGRGRGRGDRDRGAGAAGEGAGERDEVRGGHHAHRVRHLLGRRGGGRLLARPRRGFVGEGGQLVKRLKSIGAFWYDFVVGDDWRVATVVVVALALTAVLVHAVGVNAWWLLPACV